MTFTLLNTTGPRTFTRIPMTSTSLDQDAVIQYISTEFQGVDVQVASREDGSPEIAWGDAFFFYNPDPNHRERKFPFATIVTKDYADFDAASNLNRPGVFRLNIGVDRETFQSKFGNDVSSFDFTALDLVMPHPVYAKQHWICVLNPSQKTLEDVHSLLAAAHAVAVRKHSGHDHEDSTW